MARKCTASGKAKLKGRKVSHSHIRTIKHWKPNLRKVKVRMPNGTIANIKVSMNIYKKLKKTGVYKKMRLLTKTAVKA
ncbi:MAG TPA: 50S ribosomal protein L28 [candidate division WWE3 bacterium]|uniref:Large ribosomal subunit protein bL28 n=1 Tax=candidate division WWE3 bacterium TaxID=2053526 RepID=A0A7V5J067_UNCKA|nr:50S ribosomal protein L28 [candidate division WWE3 bacterium]